MAQVLNTFFLKEGRGGSVSKDGTTQDESVIIVFDAIVEDVDDAVVASGFKPGQQHRSGKFIFLDDSISAEVHQDDTGITWIFGLTYSSRSFNLTQNAN